MAHAITAGATLHPRMVVFEHTVTPCPQYRPQSSTVSLANPNMCAACNVLLLVFEPKCV